MDYNEILEDAIEFRKRFALVDVELKIVKKDRFLIADKCKLIDVLGRGNEDLMIESFKECELNEFFSKEGVYVAEVLLSFVESDGTQPDYYVIEAMNSEESNCSGCEGHYQFDNHCPICQVYPTNILRNIGVE